ncbi:MAG TPA: 2,3-bisphosphoglycerate-independent phosphoglycerate mutase [Thermoanaerobaculia bacterium]|nr:2,3-bisphosphoglycerate-independent phosphoglycerate mutase [Thermoanaerobaculia bacterium]
MNGRPPLVILIVLDGFGCRREIEWNAARTANTPTLSKLFDGGNWTTLEASGLHVGLPDGQMGNSEVGHLNMGAGRVVDQDIVRISKSIGQAGLDSNTSLLEAVKRCAASGRSIHLVGLLSDGGVHSLQTHLHGLVDSIERIASRTQDAKSPDIFVHAILDGRDTPPVSAKGYVTSLLEHLATRRTKLASIIGRYYAMDRDRRAERIKRSYDLMTLGIGTVTSDPLATLDQFYLSGITDEFMEPIAVTDLSGQQRGVISEGDSVIFFNFRADRMRQIVTAFTAVPEPDFERSVTPAVALMSMVQYREGYAFPLLFPPLAVEEHLGEVLSNAGLRQLRIAETEKYAHVTFFFNGGSDTAFPGESRILIPSPKVATYDLKPEMSLPELAARVASEIDGNGHDVIILNIANPDMVGHTGVMTAAVTAVEATDRAIGVIIDAVSRAGGVALITADHGNCELMYDPATGQPHTAHTTNPVPLILHCPTHSFQLSGTGSLENIAPTILEILGIAKPSTMTASSLLAFRDSERSSR